MFITNASTALKAFHGNKITAPSIAQNTGTSSSPADGYTPQYAEDFGKNDRLIYGGGGAASIAAAAIAGNALLPGAGLTGSLFGAALGGAIGAIHGIGDDLFLHDTGRDFATVRRGAVGAWIGCASGIAGAAIGNLLGSGTAGAVVGTLLGGAISHKVNSAWLDRRTAEYDQFRSRQAH